MQYSGIRSKIESLLENNLSDTIKVAYENTYVDPPDGEHLEVSDSDVTSEPVCIGSPNRIIRGILTIQIFTRSGSGTEPARQIAQMICKVFSTSAEIEGISFTGNAELVSVGNKEGSTLYQHNLLIPYLYEYSE